VKPQNSPIANFHKRLAARKPWTLDQLAEAIQERALSAQGSVGAEKKPSMVSHEYVKSMLYGRRQMPHRWRIATATALGFTLEEYEQQRASAVHAAGSITRVADALPIHSWPHFAWKSRASKVRRIAALLYGLSTERLALEFSVVGGQWRPPAGFLGYDQMRNEAWQEFSRNFVRMKKEPPIPKPIWHVQRVQARRQSLVKLDLLQADFRDVLITGNYQGLNLRILTDAGVHCRVEEWLASHWKAADLSQPVLPGARQLVVNIMVITKEGTAVLSKQGPDNPEASTTWCPSVSTVLNPKIDSNNFMLPDLSRAASRGCREELGIETDGQAINWLTVAAGLKYGSITVFGVLETDKSQHDIASSVESNLNRMRKDPTHVCQVTATEFLKISAKEVLKRLKVCDYRPYLELGLSLLLWKKGEATVISAYPSNPQSPMP
jgi:hypothetical protein